MMIVGALLGISFRQCFSTLFYLQYECRRFTLRIKKSSMNQLRENQVNDSSSFSWCPCDLWSQEFLPSQAVPWAWLGVFFEYNNEFMIRRYLFLIADCNKNNKESSLTNRRLCNVKRLLFLERLIYYFLGFLFNRFNELQPYSFKRSFTFMTCFPFYINVFLFTYFLLTNITEKRMKV